jgi:hypothetical protein
MIGQSNVQKKTVMTISLVKTIMKSKEHHFHSHQGDELSSSVNVITGFYLFLIFMNATR